MIRILLVLILLLIPSTGYAQDPDGRWIRQSIRSSCEWWENCPRYRWRYVRARHIEIRNVYRRERDDRYAPDCKDFVVAVGEERYGRDRAKESAEQAWMEQVRDKCGVRFMDLRNAARGTWECGRSSTGNRQSEKSADLVGKYLEQCTLRAVPKRAELERVSKD